MTQLRANGKLLLTGEYAVLDGALALALPTRTGQTLDFKPGGDTLRWQSFDAGGDCWFEAEYAPGDLRVLSASDVAVAERLAQVLRAAHRMNAGFRPAGSAVTRLEFSRHWGLGTSSTLIAIIAAWAGVEAYDLLEATFGGSGYDIACANASGPLLFQRHEGRPHWEAADFSPPFAGNLWFAYLGQKQNSREGIRRYRERAAAADPQWINSISRITAACLEAASLAGFEALLREHERLVSSLLGIPPVQEVLFPDHPGAVKSLGAWGGDFILLTHAGDEAALRTYLKERGIGVCLGYGELVLRWGDEVRRP